MSDRSKCVPQTYEPERFVCTYIYASVIKYYYYYYYFIVGDYIGLLAISVSVLKTLLFFLFFRKTFCFNNLSCHQFPALCFSEYFLRTFCHQHLTKATSRRLKCEDL